MPIVVQQEITSGPAKGQTSEIKFSDYQEVDGMYFAFSMNAGMKGTPGGQAITITKIELNPEVDASEFKFPEEITTEDKK